MKSTKLFNGWIFKLSTSFIISSGLVLSLIFINPISELKNIIMLELSVDGLFEIIWFFILGWSILELSLFISRIMEKLIPWEISARKRFIVQLIVQCLAIVSVLMIFIFITELMFFTEEGEEFDDDLVGLRQFLFIIIILSLVVTTIHSGHYLINKWKDSILETSKLKQVVLESQLQSLKLQLDPHFLFNNFSTLSSLIADDQDKAQDFLESLSQVHRYMLFNLDKNVVSLKSELEFIASYIYLIKIRFRNNLDIHIADIYDSDHKGIPPIVLQILIENAVKHNIATKNSPLKIQIFADQEFIVISNNLQRIPDISHSSKIGLRNIIDRYTLLSEKQPLILETKNEFTVKLPLLDLNTEIQ